MIQKIKKLVASLTLMGVLAVPIVAPVAVYAQASVDCGGIQACLNNGAKATDPTSTGEPVSKVNDIIKLVINIFSLIVGVIAVIMIIVGGLKYITSSGDSGNVTGAKNTILYAIVGLVVVALAQIIVRFVLSKVTNSAAA